MYNSIYKMSAYLTDDEICDIINGFRIIDRKILLVIVFGVIISYIVCWKIF